MTYDPDEVRVLDLSAATPAANLEEGAVEGTNLTVVAFTPGRIVFEARQTSKTVFNVIKFMALTNDYTEITYTIE